MREIKFRAWDGKMYHYLVATSKEHNHYLQVGEKGFWLYSSINGDLIACTNDGGILEQFVGSKDKNGIDIYENDLLKCGDFIGRIFYRSDGCKYMWEYISSKGYFDATFHDAGYRSEVIGNIHQNPELLK